MHVFREIEESLFRPPAGYEGRAEGFRRADLIHRAQGSLHMGFSIAELQPGGRVDPCVHAYEKGMFVTEGEVELYRDGELYRLGRHDYALVPTGSAHAVRNRGAAPARWVEKCAPQPKPAGEWDDTLYLPPVEWPGAAMTPEAANPMRRMVGHFDPGQLPPPARVDAYMWGWSKRLLIDRVLGSAHFDLFIIEFAEGGQTSLHDHPFEEAYLVLEGEVTYVAEGKEYVLRPGTIAWSGVGAPHGFFLNRGTSARWLEVMTPQPPVRGGNRRLATWDDLRARLGG